MVCAKELNIPQISEYMKHMGITDEELEQLSDQMMDMMDGDSFEMGGFWNAAAVSPEHDEEYAKYAAVFGRQSERGRRNPPERRPYHRTAEAKQKRKAEEKERLEIPEQLLHEPQPEGRGRQDGCHHWTG